MSIRFPTPWLVLLPALWLAACAQPPRRAEPAPPRPEAVPRAEPRARLGNPPFYDVEGKRYFVLDSADGYLERGIASWYGPDFHGGRTSTGETYDMDAMTGAHPTLPLPVWVQVTNLQNGRSITVRLNDRGPFRKNRIIDLSRAAALRLDMVRDGTAMVEVRAISPAGAVPQAPSAARRFYAQAGAFADEGNAGRLASQLRDARVGEVSVAVATVDGRRIHRVRVGPVGNVAEFDQLVERLRTAGIESPRLAAE